MKQKIFFYYTDDYAFVIPKKGVTKSGIPYLYISERQLKSALKRCTAPVGSYWITPKDYEWTSDGGVIHFGRYDNQTELCADFAAKLERA